MEPNLQIPILLNGDSSLRIGGPATISEVAKAEVRHALSLLSVDNETFDQCLTAAQIMFQIIQRRYIDSPIKTDSISIELGISATGKVGFLGTGMDVQAAAKIQISLSSQKEVHNALE